jgi:hypothetical protein
MNADVFITVVFAGAVGLGVIVLAAGLLVTLRRGKRGQAPGRR